MSHGESTANVMQQEIRSSRLRMMCGTAMLSAAAYVLMFLEFPIPMLIPSFIKMDFSELPALLASFAYGPVSGVLVCLIKNLLHLANTHSGGVGELSNFILGAIFVFTAGMVYKKLHSKKGAVLGALIGAILMSAVSVFSNYYLVYPIYTAFMPMEAIIGAYKAIIPAVDGLWQCLIIFNMPFTFVKGLCSVIFTLLIYKPLSPILKGNN
ncbi:MAG: ECF transporter S component [Lachnospiraceae bacterium]|nr:ECF transporter S component [Lachnospiraceae bacterium]